MGDSHHRQANKPNSRVVFELAAKKVGIGLVGGKVTVKGAIRGKAISGASVTATGARVGPSTGGEPNRMDTACQNALLNPPNKATWAIKVQVVCSPSQGQQHLQGW